MEDRINQALAQLEKDLQEINSARNQVESTVKASIELQKVVSEYVSSVKALGAGLRAWESELSEREGGLAREYAEVISRVNSTCNEIISSFGAEVEKTSADFKNKTNSVVEKFTEQIGKLEKHVQELNALREEIKKTTGEIESVKETLTQISIDLKESQDQQDEVLNDIKQKSVEIKSNVEVISSSAERNSEKLDAIIVSLNEGFSSFDQRAESISSDLSRVNNACQSIITSTSEMKTSLQSFSEQLIKSINDYRASTSKFIIINRWITIVAFMLLAILYLTIK